MRGLAYIGRFAPSPTGPLHAGSVVAALASWLDARAAGHGSRWLVRIEDLDRARCRPEWSPQILQQLQALGLTPDETPQWQSQRVDRYARALQRLHERGLVYPCSCSRRDIETRLASLGTSRLRNSELVYPGTCRQGTDGKPVLAMRFRNATAASGNRNGTHPTTWTDRRLGVQQQDVAQAVGDFVVQRADGSFTYQLAVVVDDAEQGVTDVVRGADLADNTARQILLQRALGLPTPRYLHTPVVQNAAGEKLSKQSGAQPVDTTRPLAALKAAAAALGLCENPQAVLADALAAWVAQWRGLYNPQP